MIMQERIPDANGNIGNGIPFKRIRRITGYLVGDVKRRFNDAKQAEERDRVKHGFLRASAVLSVEDSAVPPAAYV